MSLTSEEKRLLELNRKLESRDRGEALLFQAEALLKSQTAQEPGHGTGCCDQEQAVAQAAACSQRMA